MSRDVLPHDQRRARRPGGTDVRLTRSRDDRRLAGIAGGVAAFTGSRSARVRLLFALVLPLSLGIAVIGYLLLWVLLPLAPEEAPPA